MSSTPPTPWPLSAARSTGASNTNLLHAILATQALDEISTFDDYAHVRRYISTRGRPDLDQTGAGRTIRGLMFWVFPGGKEGPFHETGDGRLKKHGLLVTVEAGSEEEEVVRRVKDGLVDGIIRHEHVGRGGGGIRSSEYTFSTNASTTSRIEPHADTQSSKQFPASVAHSTGETNFDLLYTILASVDLDEISTAEEYTAIRNYVFNQHQSRSKGKRTQAERGSIFWVYPTGMFGPFHRDESDETGGGDGQVIRYHGLLLTVEPDVLPEEVVERVRVGLQDGRIRHEHVGV
ncbi:hypothetical protein FB446DRAFT_785392 [Lentinula raphanica]|nr:hypothetical protein FB446DRAFT_785392 [Lentinula raphanica]